MARMRKKPSVCHVYGRSIWERNLNGAIFPFVRFHIKSSCILPWSRGRAAGLSRPCHSRFLLMRR